MTRSKMHPVGKMIAKAAQKYGFVIWDKAGAISIRAEFGPLRTIDYPTAPPPYAVLWVLTEAWSLERFQPAYGRVVTLDAAGVT